MSAPVSAATAVASGNYVQPFYLATPQVGGRLVRLNKTLDEIIDRHGYPEAVGTALAEAVLLTALFATGIKFDNANTNARFTLQTRTDGPLGFLVVHFDPPGQMRAYASIAKDRGADIPPAGRLAPAQLLGTGHLAMTIDPGGSLDSHQGIVPLTGESLVDAAHTYFRQSEQLPTFIRAAVGRSFVDGAWRWTAGALMVQSVPRLRGDVSTLSPEEAEARDRALNGEDEEDWQRTRILAATVEDHELLDPAISPERLLLRLFHEEAPRVSAPIALSARCKCSRERLGAFLSRFTKSELADMREADGFVRATCEFCKTDYRFSADDLAGDLANDRG